MTVDNDSTTVHRPVRSRDEILDAAEIREFLDSAYGVRLRLRQMRNDRPSLRHARVDIGPVTVDDVQLPGGLEASPDPLNRVVAVWTERGRVSGQCGDLVSGAGPDEVTLLSQPDLPYRVESDDAHTTTVLLDPGLLAAEAGTPTRRRRRTADQVLEFPSRRRSGGPSVERHRPLREAQRAEPG